ncbi:uncharacterized protein LOC127281595 isoform X2 [Leptopilina boulardi]|uniref:uncharacterized protein LOC127281595 isoform X2 n=1 Tax=Leptopilina boulardi TaxID=63433 RepID=UPI0021F54B90|nr:uncharacterized protein LOC127281595 isoform X2 [Leptopilina boulardi]
MVDKSEKKKISSSLQKIKFQLPNVGQHLRSLLKWRYSKRTKAKEELTIFTMTEASFIIPEITREILERVLLEIAKLNDEENEIQFQTTDNPMMNSRSKLTFEKWRFTSEFIPSIGNEPSMSSTSSSLPRLSTSETQIEHRSEASAINASSSNLSAFPSNTFENTTPGVNLGNFISDPIIYHYNVEYLLAINSMGYNILPTLSLTGGQFDSMSAPLYQVNESQTESYGGSSTSGTISDATDGSEQSNSYSETMETMDSMSEQDLNRQYYQVLHAIIRKQFDFLDDDSPIY